MTGGLGELAAQLTAWRPASGPFLVGVTGAVAAGKSTLAAQLAETMRTPAEAVDVISTDGFLMPNVALEAVGLLNRKGFPETFDLPAMRRALAAVRTAPVDFPGYSHGIYDIDPGLTRRIEPPGVLIVEGLGLHEGAAAVGLDALVYLDAEEDHIEAWFTGRLLDLWRAAEHDPSSFYARFRHFTEPQAREFAAMVWRTINLPNLRENISGAREVADIVVTKGPDHAIVSVRARSA